MQAPGAKMEPLDKGKQRPMWVGWGKEAEPKELENRNYPQRSDTEQRSVPIAADH